MIGLKTAFYGLVSSTPDGSRLFRLRPDRRSRRLRCIPQRRERLPAPPSASPALPEVRSQEEILAMLPQRTVEEPAPTPSQTTRPDRPRRMIRIKTSDEQLAAVSRLFHEHNDTLPGSEIAARTRLTPSTVSRLLHKLRRGEDITKRPKRGRNPKYTPPFSGESPASCASRTRRSGRQRPRL